MRNKRVLLTAMALALFFPLFSGAAPTGTEETSTRDGESIALPSSTIHLKFARFNPLDGEPAIPSMLTAGATNTVRLVQISGPLTSNGIASLEDAGALILGYIPDFTYIAHITAANLPAVRALDIVRWVGEFHPAYKIQAGLLEIVEDDVDLNVLYFPEVARGGRPDAIEAEAQAQGGLITTYDEHFPVLRIRIPPDGISSLAALPEVRWIDRYDPPVHTMNHTRTATGASAASAGGFDGAGIVGEVKDDGIDQNHQDFGNLIGTYDNPQVNSHGTCTFGIVFGDGTGNSSATGMMPEGDGVFCNWNASRSSSISNLRNTWGGVFQSNSWYQGTPNGDYNSYSNQDDEAIVTYDVMMLYSTGNSNNGVGATTISTDAAAKNVIGVGAVFHQNTATLADDQWENHGWYNTPSQGPAADGRIKPDLCAFFDWILCTDRPGSPGYSGGDYVSSFGGTSAACPIVAGAVGLVYDMYDENHFGNNPGRSLPKSATVKAMLIANAYQYSLSDATRYQQGWGLPDLDRIYSAASNQLIVDGGNPLGTGETWSTTVGRYNDSEALKISLVWNDEPGETSASTALVNDLDLMVTAPNGTVFRGNVGLVSNLWSSADGSCDRKNNVENVFIQNPLPGAYVVQVSAYNVAMDNDPEPGVNQDFSLVASMVTAGGEPLDPMGLSIEMLDPATVRLSWSSVSGATHYDLYRSTSPYFSATAFPWQTVLAPTTFLDCAEGICDPSVNYFYMGVARNASEQSPESNIVGEFDTSTDDPTP
jgi:serine protease AprX